jgi:two-component system, cell cycle sensor histidine kinase and response regulator CckA
MPEMQDLARPTPSEYKSRTEAHPGLTGNPRLLIVDDSAELRQLYRMALEQFGCRVGIADDGEQALEQYQAAMRESDPYRVVLLDINLPGMDGQECFKRIREINDTARVIITSGDRLGMEDPAFSPAAGMLPKPFRLKSLIQGVADALDSPLSSGHVLPRA